MVYAKIEEVEELHSRDMCYAALEGKTVKILGSTSKAYSDAHATIPAKYADMSFEIHPNGGGIVFEGAEVDPNARIEWPAVVFPGAKVEATAEISGDVEIYAGSIIRGAVAEFAQLGNVIVEENSQLRGWSYFSPAELGVEVALEDKITIGDGQKRIIISGCYCDTKGSQFTKENYLLEVLPCSNPSPEQRRPYRPAADHPDAPKSAFEEKPLHYMFRMLNYKIDRLGTHPGDRELLQALKKEFQLQEPKEEEKRYDPFASRYLRKRKLPELDILQIEFPSEIKEAEPAFRHIKKECYDALRGQNVYIIGSTSEAYEDSFGVIPTQQYIKVPSFKIHPNGGGIVFDGAVVDKKARVEWPSIVFPGAVVEASGEVSGYSQVYAGSIIRGAVAEFAIAANVILEKGHQLRGMSYFSPGELGVEVDEKDKIRIGDGNGKEGIIISGCYCDAAGAQFTKENYLLEILPCSNPTPEQRRSYRPAADHPWAPKSSSEKMSLRYELLMLRYKVNRLRTQKGDRERLEALTAEFKSEHPKAKRHYGDCATVAKMQRLLDLGILESEFPWESKVAKKVARNAPEIGKIIERFMAMGEEDLKLEAEGGRDFMLTTFSLFQFFQKSSRDPTDLPKSSSEVLPGLKRLYALTKYFIKKCAELEIRPNEIHHLLVSNVYPFLRTHSKDVGPVALRDMKDFKLIMDAFVQEQQNKGLDINAIGVDSYAELKKRFLKPFPSKTVRERAAKPFGLNLWVRIGRR